jgi:peptidoglycan/xylan/chitin deacetylase (PgdA/CDA1 family)
VEKGHEISLHGYTHEFVSTLSEEQQRDVLKKSISVLTDIVGKKPRGWTAPAWSTSKETVALLEEFGIVTYPKSALHSQTRNGLPYINRNTTTPSCTTTLNPTTYPLPT